MSQKEHCQDADYSISSSFLNGVGQMHKKFCFVGLGFLLVVCLVLGFSLFCFAAEK